MEVKLIMKSARNAVIEIADGGIYNTKETYHVLLNGEEVFSTDTVINSLFDLKPQTSYEVSVRTADGTELGTVSFVTAYEFVTLNVRDFGATGDGKQDDTKFIQAAILACPKESRVLIPKGSYRITSLFLKSNLRLELAKGAELIADTDRAAYPKFPGMIESYDEQGEYNLGTWEGNPLPMFAGIITGLDVENVLIYGRDKWQCFKRKLVEKSESHGRSIPPASVFLKPLSECDTLWCNFQEQSVLDTASVFFR